MVVAEEVQQTVYERPTPTVADNLRAQDDVSESARDAGGQLVTSVDGKREYVGLLVDTEVLRLERPDLVRSTKAIPSSPSATPSGENPPGQLRGRVFVDAGSTPVLDLDLDHLRRAVPVSSACRLYASTIRCTSLWRTTSSCLNSTNATPSIEARISRT